MFSFLRPSALAFFVLAVCTLASSAQQATPTPTPQPSPAAEQKPPANANAKVDLANMNAEQVTESTILVYGSLGGRAVLDQIRKTTFERGKTSVMNAEGKMENANYQKWIIRGPSLDKEKIRLDQEFPSLRYSLVQNADKVFMIFNDSIYSPREDVAKAFHEQVYRGLDGLLRYKENGSKIELGGKEKILGVDLFLIDVTDAQGQKTRYFISQKRFRVLGLEYELGGKKYHRKFYDYNYAQGTLVPFRTVLTVDGKVVEDTTVGTITFGQKVDESLFPAGS